MNDTFNLDESEEKALNRTYESKRIFKAGDRYLGPTPANTIAHYACDAIIDYKVIESEDEGKSEEVPSYMGIDSEVLSYNSATRTDSKQVTQLSLSLVEMIHRANRLEEHVHVNVAIDLVLDTLDELFRRGQFALCDSMLLEIDVEEYSSDILMTILTATSHARSELSVREDFLNRTKEVFRRRGDLRPNVLDSLE